MNAFLRWLLPVFASVAVAADPNIEPWQVRAELQIIHLDEASAVPLVAQFTDDPQRAGAELQRLLTGGNATLAAHLIGRTFNNMKCDVEQFEERRHPIEFSPIDPALVPVRKLGPPPDPIPFPGTAFEYRRIGTSLSITPFVYPGGRIVGISTEIIRRDFGGMERFESAVQRDGTKLCFELPINFVRNAQASLLVHAGIPTLLGCCKLQNQARRFELHILTTHVRLFGEPLPRLSRKFDPRNSSLTSDAVPVLPIAQTRIELHRFILPEADALRLRPALLDSAKIESTFTTLLANARNGLCELAGILAIPLHDGAHAAFRNDREQLYPTEYSNGGHMGRPTTPLPPQPARCNPPSAFERRDVGEQFEAERKFSATEDAVNLQFKFDNTLFHGFHRWATGGDARSNSVNTYSYQPDFSVLSTSADVSLADGQRTLLRFHKLPAPDRRVEIALIRAVTERFTPETKQ